jgi:anaerobic selenocysteine-containing dehydrogenase
MGDLTTSAPWSRRCFLKLSTLLGSSFFSAFSFGRDTSLPACAQDAATGMRIIRVGCPSHNCGGRCLLKVTVLDGTIVRTGPRTRWRIRNSGRACEGAPIAIASTIATAFSIR